MPFEKTIEALRNAECPQDVNERRQLYEAARQLMFKVETEHELTHRVYFAALPLHFAKLGVDLGLFRFMSKNPEKRYSCAELAEECKAAPILLSRILRGLAAHGMIKEFGNDTFSANAATKTLANPNIEAGIDHNHLNANPDIQYIPPFLRKTGYKDPNNVFSSVFHMAHDTDMEPFAWLAQHPENLKAATTHMWSSRTGQRTWVEDDSKVPTEDFTMSADDVEKGRVLMVDVGGGSGHQCMMLRTHQPQFKGRVVLEDLPGNFGVVDKPRLDSLKVECVEHDFTKPQPIRGAKVYYIRNVLHDWSDEKDLIMLKHVREAMAEDSVVVVDEMVVRTDKSQWKQVNYDFHSMVLAGMERTEEHWKRLLEEAGLKLRNVIEYDGETGDSLLIAIPA